MLLEQSRIEAKGSISFKGIKSNITKKHLLDLKKNSNNEQKIYCQLLLNMLSYEKFLNVDFGDTFNEQNRNIIKEKLGKDYEKIFKDLKKV